MSWPIGYGTSRVKYSATREGTIVADGVSVTNPNGWVDLAATEPLQMNGAPARYSLRVRLSLDARGHSFFYAEEVIVGGVRYGGLHALAKARGSEWLSAPVLAARARLDPRSTEVLAENDTRMDHSQARTG